MGVEMDATYSELVHVVPWSGPSDEMALFQLPSKLSGRGRSRTRQSLPPVPPIFSRFPKGGTVGTAAILGLVVGARDRLGQGPPRQEQGGQGRTA